MLSIDIKTIPHAEQRYPTVGDWWWTGETLYLRVSELSCWQYEFLVAAHEMIECFLCKLVGVVQEDVDRFDKLFEEERGVGKHDADDEPGDDPRAPYWFQHQVSTGIERTLAALLRVDWVAYEAELAAVLP